MIPIAIHLFILPFIPGLGYEPTVPTGSLSIKDSSCVRWDSISTELDQNWPKLNGHFHPFFELLMCHQHRITLRIMSLAVAFALTNQVWSQTEVSGSVSGTWTLASSPYLVTDDVVIAENESLRIDAGVTVLFRDASDDLFVQGSLVASGTATSPIRFTSNDSAKEPGQWGAIVINDSSDDSQTRFDHCVIEYGGGFRNHQVEVNGASPTLSNCTIRSGRVYGLSIVRGNPIIRDCLFTNNLNYALTADVQSFPRLSGTQATSNGHDAIGRHGGRLTSSGTWVRDNIPYTVIDDITIPADIRLDIEPGSIVQFQDASDDLFVDGTLKALGQATRPIRFTSNELEPTPGDWGALVIRGPINNSETELAHCVVEFGGGFRNQQIAIEKASPTLTNLSINHGRVHGLSISGADPTLEGCQFNNNAGYSLVVDVFAFPHLANSSAAGNGHNAIGRSGGTLTASGLWVHDSIPYTIIDDIVVAEGLSLTIESGTVVQFQDASDDLFIDGTLLAIGKADAPIRFTTNKTDSEPGLWGAVIFRDQGASRPSMIDWCIFEYGGGFRNEIVLFDRASPSMNHSTIQHGRVRGLSLTQSTSSIENSEFLNNNSFAMTMDVHSFPQLSGNIARDNGSNAFGVHGGRLETSGTWNADDIPFTVIDDILIAENGQLSIKPGSTIQVQDASDDLLIEGSLHAQGTADLPIRFTSASQDKAPGQWGVVVVRPSANTERTLFQHCIFEYGGGFQNETVRFESNSPQFINSQINHSRRHGLSLINAHSSIINSSFAGNRDYAVVMDTKSFPTWQNNHAGDNSSNSIGISGGNIERSGTWHQSILPYTIIDDIVVTPSGSLSIQAGTVIQFQDGSDDLFIDGTLIANGTASLPIRFTSNDTEKAPAQWGSIIFRGSSNDADSSISFAELEYGGGFRNGTVELINASPSLNAVQIQNSRAAGLYTSGSQSSIRHSSFRNNGGDGIRTTAASTIQVGESTFEGNGGLGINNIDTGSLIEATQNYWGAASGPLDTKNDDELNQTNPDGLGDAVSEFVRWEPFLASPASPVMGSDPVIAVGTTAIAFGDLRLEQTATQTIRITNTGDAPLSVIDIDSTSTQFAPQTLSIPNIAPGDSIDIRITFTPTVIGPLSASLSISTNDPTTPITRIQLTGTGIEQALPPTPGTPGIPTRITFDPNQELFPSWHPNDNRIAFATDRTPGDFNDLGLVNANATGERLLATGPQQGFGLVPFTLNWVGNTDLLAITEAVVFHEYLTYDTTQSPFQRTARDGNDQAFERKLLIDGGGGGELFEISRDGSTALWRFSTQGGRGTITLRTAPYTSLTGQSAQQLGTIHLTETLPIGSPRHINGAGLYADGSHFVVSLRSGDGYDLYLYTSDESQAPQQLTNNGASSGAHNSLPQVSPDNRYVAYVYRSGQSGNQNDIRVLDTKTGETNTITNTPLLTETSPSWSPDGEQLVYARFDTIDTDTLLEGEAPNWNLYTIDLSETATTPPLPPVSPRLEITRIGQQITLTWSDPAQQYILETTTNLTPPIDWASTPNAPSIDGEHRTLTQDIDGQHRAFRLRKIGN